MSEHLKTREIQPATISQPLAARAVALCEGCPMAKFCVTERPGECPPDIRQFDGSVEQPMTMSQPPKSYRKQLRDDSQLVVMATPRKVEQPPGLQVPVPKPTHKTSSQQKLHRQSRATQGKPAGESVSERVADVLMDMFSVKSLQKARAKK